MNKISTSVLVLALLAVLLVAGCTGRQDNQQNDGTGTSGDTTGAGALGHDDEFTTAVQDFSTILTDTQDAQSDMGDFSTDDASTPSAG